MRDAIWFPCFDAFCTTCLPKDSPNSCPTCGEASAQATDNFFSKLAEVTTVIATWAGAKYMCQITGCSPPRTAQHYCVVCRKKMCDDCQRQHQRFHSEADHYVFQPETNSVTDVFQAMKKRSSETIDDIKLENSLQCFTETLAQLKKTTSKTITEVEDKKEKLIEKIDLDSEEAKKKMSKEVESWRDEKSEELRRRFNNWKSPWLRARRRWAALAKELIEKGSINEKLENSKRLNDRLDRLREADSAEPTLSCDEVLVYKPSESIHQGILGTLEVAKRADPATDFGMHTNDAYLCFVHKSAHLLHTLFVLFLSRDATQSAVMPQ